MAWKKFTFHYRLSLRDLSPTLLEDTGDTYHAQTRAGILVSLDLPCQAKDEDGSALFCGVEENASRKRALQLPNLPCEDQPQGHGFWPRPASYCMDGMKPKWLLFGEMLYTRLERLEAKLEIDLNLQILEISCVIASMMPGINGPSRKHDISRSKKISPSTQDLDLSLFEDPGKARQFSKQTSPLTTQDSINPQPCLLVEALVATPVLIPVNASTGFSCTILATRASYLALTNNSSRPARHACTAGFASALAPLH